MPAAARLTDSATYVPTPEEQGHLISFVEAMRERGQDVQPQPVVVTAAGERYELTTGMADMLVNLLRILANGQAVTIVPRHRLLTTQEAADLLNISRPTLIKILERGDVPYEMRGRHRRIRLDDLLAYQVKLHEQRAEALDEMTRSAQEEGLYDILDVPPASQE